MQEVTIETIRTSLGTNDRAVEKAFVLLFACQTFEEQESSATKESNNIGFNGVDALKGTYYAKWILGLGRYPTQEKIREAVRDYLTHGYRPGINRRLDGRYMVDARKRVLKYAGQLLRIRNTLKK